MKNCPSHNVPLTYRGVTRKDGTPSYVWSCPEKDGERYCTTSEWAKSKTPGEEMVNVLAGILCEAQRTREIMESMQALREQARPQAARPSNFPPKPQNDNPVRTEDIGF